MTPVREAAAEEGSARRFSSGQAVRHGLLVGLWFAAAYWTFLCVGEIRARGDIGFDAHAYWNALQSFTDPYGAQPGERDAFNYTPPFLLLLAPLRHLAWTAFFVGWLVVCLLVFVWLLRPLGLALGVPVFGFLCVRELMLGNVFAFMALSLVLIVTTTSWGGRGAAASFLLFTKLSPALIVLWLPATRQWRASAGTAVVAASVGLVSALVTPGLWWKWGSWLGRADDGADAALYGRLLVALLLLLAAAHWVRPELLAVSLILSLPWIGGSSVLSLLAAWPRLAAHGRRVRDAGHGACPSRE